MVLPHAVTLTVSVLLAIPLVVLAGVLLSVRRILRSILRLLAVVLIVLLCLVVLAILRVLLLWLERLGVGLEGIGGWSEVVSSAILSTNVEILLCLVGEVIDLGVSLSFVLPRARHDGDQDCPVSRRSMSCRKAEGFAILWDCL